MIDAKPQFIDTPSGRVLDEKHFWTVLCADQMWRLNNLYYIKDKSGNRVKFRMKPEQRHLFENKHTRNIILKARQLGFTTFIQLYMLDSCLFGSNVNAGVVAHTKEDAQDFFEEKIKFAYDNLLPLIKSKFRASTDTAKQLSFPNGSVIRVGTSLRSGTYQIIHISEFGKLCAKHPEKAKETITGSQETVPTDGEVFIESTAEGAYGRFYDMCRISMAKEPTTQLDYKFFFFPWYTDQGYTIESPEPLRPEAEAYFDNLDHLRLTHGQKLWYDKKWQIAASEMKREYPTFPEEAFEASVEGAYYKDQMSQIRAKGHITSVPIDPFIPIHTFWDLGRDTTAIWFFQQVGYEYRFVRYYQNSGKDYSHYVKYLRDLRDGDQPLNYGTIFLPHDGDRKSIVSRFSFADIMEDNGFDVHVVPRTHSIDQSIENVRRTLPQCVFDRDNCAQGVACLDNYSPEWDEKREVNSIKPRHDAASHGADAFRTFVEGWAREQEFEEYEESYQMTGANRMTGY